MDDLACERQQTTDSAPPNEAEPSHDNDGHGQNTGSNLSDEATSDIVSLDNEGQRTAIIATTPTDTDRQRTINKDADDIEQNDNDFQQQQDMDVAEEDADAADIQVPQTPSTLPKSKKGRQPTSTAMLDVKNGGSSNAKRKTNSFYVNMLDFVKLVLRTAVDVAIRKGVFDDDLINTYVKELTMSGTSDSTKTESCGKLVAAPTPAKRIKLDVPSDGAADPPDKTVSNAAAKANKEFQKLIPKTKRSVCIRVVSLLFIALERVNANLQFSREHFKYFLATYKRSVTVSNFVDTNRIKTGANGGATAKKLKSTARLQNGAILLEYAKSPYMFASNLSRCEPTDVEALRLIVENDISVSPTIYLSIPCRLHDVHYNVDKIDTQRPDHVRIPIMNFKRATLLVSEFIVLLYDGAQFVLPTPNIERDITAVMISSAGLKRKENVVLDVLLSSKLRVIDIIGTNKEDFYIPEDYAKRLKTIAETFQGIKTVTLDENFDGGSYLQKSKFRHDAPVYIHYKPNHTLAAVGMRNNTVFLAYQDDNGDLAYRLNTVNSGPASLALCVATLQASQSGASTKTVEATPTITLEDDESNDKKQVRVLGLENETDVQLFSSVIRIELKDGNALGSLSANPVTNLREYKPPASSKDANGATVPSIDNLTAIFNDPNNYGNVLKALTKSTQFDAYIKGMHSDVVSLGSVELGYG